MNILVLGGDGFMGSHFVDQALSLCHKVTVFDRFPYKVSKNLEHIKGKIKIIAGEFANRDQVAGALKDQDIVYHFISSTNPATSWHDPFVEIETNLKQSVQFFDLAKDLGVKKIVFPSSGGSIYGRRFGALNEESLPLPFNPYGITKLAIEYFLNYFREHSGLATDVYRIGNAYGPRQPMDAPQGVIAVWMGKILSNQEIAVYGDNQTIRDYIYVEDIVYLLTHSLSDLNSSGVYNLGTGKGISVLELFEVFKTVINKSFKYKICTRRNFDNTSVVLDSSKLLSYFPEFKFQDIEEKIKDTWLYIKEQYENKQRQSTQSGI